MHFFTVYSQQSLLGEALIVLRNGFNPGVRLIGIQVTLTNKWKDSSLTQQSIKGEALFYFCVTHLNTVWERPGWKHWS